MSWTLFIAPVVSWTIAGLMYLWVTRKIRRLKELGRVNEEEKIFRRMQDSDPIIIEVNAPIQGNSSVNLVIKEAGPEEPPSRFEREDIL